MDSRGVPLDSSRRPSPVAILALVTGLLVTAALAVTTLLLYDQNENRLIGLRAKELGLVLTTAVLPTQTQLASAAALADATAGNVGRFRALLEPEVGPGRQFIAASLWPFGARRASGFVGTPPKLTPAQANELFTRARRTHTLSVLALLSQSRPGIGYAFSPSRASKGFVVYAETLVPANRRSRLESNTAFSDLNYAIYFGHSTRPSNLLVTSLKNPQIMGRRASASVPFGDGVLTLVVTPRGSLGGAFFQALPWIVAIFGLALSLAACLLADRLVRGRRQAEQLAENLDRLADENELMYTEQRSIAQTLQHALLPETLPEVRGLKVSALYVAATSGVEVGGDWYDVVAAGEHRVLLVIGDVSGHGLRAATAMASLRHATLAYAAHDARPAAILGRLAQYVNGASHDYFATVLCVLIDVEAHRMTLASAGHLPPLLIENGDAHFLEMTASPPIGVVGQSSYEETEIAVPAKATLVAFTDGLVERRGEVIDTGLARLRGAAGGRPLSLEELVAMLPEALASDGHHDDTAIVGIEWQS
jgi:serine phosphatase RsbU (regulator of sigma subunit)